MTVIFDGRAFASKKEAELKRLGKHPKLVSILIGNDPASILYVNLKKKAAERIGAQLEIINSIEEIEKLNRDESVDGIMIQLPLPKKLKDRTTEIISKIDRKKDVDGLRSDSLFVHPTAKAVLQAIEVSGKDSGTICVVGAGGMVGSALVKEFKKTKFKLIKDTTKADVVVSATGVAGLIKADMIKDNAVVIDVGSPEGDVDFDEVSKKASFITPVPGGVGPVTISCLLENLMSTVV